MGSVMASVAPGLFVGGEEADLPRDNLELERWFRLPKGHERRIHGHQHAGMRIVQEGATLLPVLDAHEGLLRPFTAEELLPYHEATMPEDEQEALQRCRIMRRARSKKNAQYY